MPPLKLKSATTVDLGRDGSKWRHGWIPLNPAAVAIKAKKPVGGNSGSDTKREALSAAVAKAKGSKSRLSTSTVRPSRLKLKGDKGREATLAPKGNSFADELTARSVASRQAHADSLGLHQTSKGTGVLNTPGSKQAREFKTMADRRKEASARAFVNSGDVRLHATKDDGGSKIGSVSKYPSGGFRAQHKDDTTAHAGSPFKTRQEAVGALVLQHESRTPKTQAERVADIRAAKPGTIAHEKAKDATAGFDKMSDAELRELSHHNGAAHAELQKRNAVKLAASKAEFQRTNSSAVNLTDKGQAHIDKLVAEKRAREAAVQKPRKGDLAVMSDTRIVTYQKTGESSTGRYESASHRIVKVGKTNREGLITHYNHLGGGNSAPIAIPRNAKVMKISRGKLDEAAVVERHAGFYNDQFESLADVKAALLRHDLKNPQEPAPGTGETLNEKRDKNLAKNALEAEKTRRAAQHTSIVSLKVTGLEGYGVTDLKRIVGLSEGPHDAQHAPADTIAKAETELRNRGYIKRPNGTWAKPAKKTAPKVKSTGHALTARSGQRAPRGSKSIGGVRFDRGEGGMGK